MTRPPKNWVREKPYLFLSTEEKWKRNKKGQPIFFTAFQLFRLE